MTFSINTRKVIFSVIGIIIISFIVPFILVFSVTINATSISLLSTSWFQIVETIVIAILGIVIGLIWERLTRTRYLAKIANLPAPSDRAKKIYRTILVLAGIVGAIYILSNIVVVYEAMASGITIPISSAQQIGIFIGIARYIALALALLWLFAEPKKENEPSTTADIKKYFLWGAIYCLIMAGVNIFGFSMFKVSNANITPLQTPSTAAVGNSAAPLNNLVGVMPTDTGPWLTNIYSGEYSFQYPSTWTIDSTSSNNFVISSSPTVKNSDNGVCWIYAWSTPNPKKISLNEWVAMSLGNMTATTSTTMLGGRPAIYGTYTGSGEPYIQTIGYEATWATLGNSSIVELMMSCGSNVLNEGQPVYQELLSTFKLL